MKYTNTKTSYIIIKDNHKGVEVLLCVKLWFLQLI